MFPIPIHNEGGGGAARAVAVIVTMACGWAVAVAESWRLSCVRVRKRPSSGPSFDKWDEMRLGARHPLPPPNSNSSRGPLPRPHSREKGRDINENWHHREEQGPELIDLRQPLEGRLEG